MIALLVAAGVTCMPAAELKAHLTTNYDETLFSAHVFNQGKSAQLLFTSFTGAWTLVVAHTTGQSCVVDRGPAPGGRS